MTICVRVFSFKTPMSSVIWLFLSSSRRHIFTSTHLLKKEIRRTEEGNVVTYEGVLCKSERLGHLFDMTGLGDPRITDPIIRLGLKLRHTDVLILTQFLRPDGTILPREVSGLTKGSQLHIEMLIERAQNAGLLPISIDASGKHMYKERGPHVKNVYYDSDITGLPKFSKIIPR
ncbi:39S ribosomal protein S18a mitochondrial [Taenia crassiceps]|uniref:39S ribosomal protein S18a mitochondrial n=1 Tax=Taenia crassiceps TaxID=6207 RepID=A0ABR4Q6C5_9CEST